MAMKSVVSRTGLRRLMETSSAAQRSSISGLRYFSDGKGRVLGEEERAQETIYIQVLIFSLFSFSFFVIYVFFVFNYYFNGLCSKNRVKWI